MKIHHKFRFVLFLILTFFASHSFVQALPNPQDPSTESIITIEADGIAPFDGSDGGGEDSSPTNDIVRNFDFITYAIEVSLNDADDTNVVTTVTLNDKAKWNGLPPECKTVANGFASLSPDSVLQDNDGDGIEETLICNLGDHTEGTKVVLRPVAQAVGNNTDMVEASVLSSSDNNVNTSGNAGTQGDGPVETEITAGFGISIDKSVSSFPDAFKTLYNPSYFEEDELGAGSPEGKVIDWHIALNYDAGSEFVADNGAGTQDFIITDTWVGTHSIDSSINSDNANGAYNDQIIMFGEVLGNPADNCSILNGGGGTVSCTQGGPGEPITISLNGVPVAQQPLATVVLRMFVPYDPVLAAEEIETYNIDNIAVLTGWGGVGTMVTSATGAVDTGPESDTNDWLTNDLIPGNLTIEKSFDRRLNIKSGQRAAFPGEIIETTLRITDERPTKTMPGVCETIDTNSFEFAGFIGAGQKDGFWHGAPSLTITGPVDGFVPYHAFHNPVFFVADGMAGFWQTAQHLDATTQNVTIDYSVVDYATTGDDHWTATCEDDLTGDGNSDWISDYTTLPGGASDVVRVRLVWDRDYAAIKEEFQTGFLSNHVSFSFDLKVKDDVTPGLYIPNTAATFDLNDSWQGEWKSSIVSGETNPYMNVEDDPSSPLYSFNPLNADRVLILASRMSIEKSSNETVALVPGDSATFTVNPNTAGGGDGAVTLTMTDTLPPELTYVSDTCSAVYAALPSATACTASVAGQVITWTITGHEIGDDLPAFEIETTVNSGVPAGTYTNTVEITSDSAALNDTSHCDDATNTSGVNDQAAIDGCIASLGHSSQASVLVVSTSGYKVQKSLQELVVESDTDFTTTLAYTNLGGAEIGEGHIIDILPHNGDGDESTLRHNSTVTNPNTSTQSAATNAHFVSIAPSSAGETFEYSTDPYANIDHRPCHPSNWPAGDSLGSGNALLDSICSRGLIDPVTDVPTASQGGAGTVTWGLLPGDPSVVTAVRMTTPVFPGSEATREITLTLNSSSSVDEDLFCNNYGSNAPNVTLDIISNDVCIPVVAGSISDYVWLDTNQDGVQDANEPPLEGITMKLLDGNGDPIYYDPATGAIVDSSDPNAIPYVATTDASGAYSFDNLPSGDYQIMVDTSTLPLGAVQTYDYDGAGDDMSAYSLSQVLDAAGNLTDVEDNDEQDFGYFYNFDLALNKAPVTQGPFAPGQDITYAITVYNQGTIDATDVTVVDTLPAGLTLNDSNWSGSPLSTVIPAVPAGEQVTVTLTATINANATGEIINVAEISEAKDGNGNTPTDIDSIPDTDPTNDTQGPDDTIDGTDGDEDDSDPAGITLTPVVEPETPIARISLLKSIASVSTQLGLETDLVDAGDQIVYTFIVTNTGQTHLGIAQDAITDNLVGSITCPTTPALAPGDSLFCIADNPYTITDADVRAGGVENTALVTGNPVDPEGNDLPNIPDVRDVSDTGTDPEARTVPDPEAKETPNPLNKNPNDPGDTTEDPTTYLISPLPVLVCTQESEIGNKIFEDINCNGKYDKDIDKPLDDITVKLKDEDGNTIDKDKTNSKGKYELRAPGTGRYQVYVDKDDIKDFVYSVDPGSDSNPNNKAYVSINECGDDTTKMDFGFIIEECELAKTGSDVQALMCIQ